MFLGYNTNGFAHHRLRDAIDIIAELGYQGIALTPDVHHLDPWAADYIQSREQVRRQLGELGLASVIETGARFLLDPRRKHQPTLLSPDPAERKVRREFLETCIDLAATLGSRVISFWSGTPLEPTSDEVLYDRLATECRGLAEYAVPRGVALAFEPEPGMFIDTMPRFRQLRELVDHSAFGLTLDIGHLNCQGELPVGSVIEEFQDCLWNVHIEDMRRGVHDHLMFGEGEVDFPDVFTALRRVGYRGGIYVELSRHSHDAVRTAQRSRAFLQSQLAAGRVNFLPYNGGDHFLHVSGLL